MRVTPTRLLVAVALVAVAGAVVVTRISGGNPIVDEAIGVLGDDERFQTATDSGVAFARVASLLADAGRDCGAGSERCGRYFTAAAFAQVTAVRVLDCTRPPIFEARRAMRAYLAGLGSDTEPTPPGPPDCD